MESREWIDRGVKASFMLSTSPTRSSSPTNTTGRLRTLRGDYQNYGPAGQPSSSRLRLPILILCSSTRHGSAANADGWQHRLLREDGDFWRRRHNVDRAGNYHLATGVSRRPDLQLLEDTRLTYKEFADGTDYHVEDSGKVDGEPTESTPTPWTRRIIVATISAPTRCSTSTMLPTKGEYLDKLLRRRFLRRRGREQQNLFHLPYRSWCKICR